MRRATAFAALALAFALASCSTDSDTPVGSQFTGGLLGTQPGTVFQDTVAVYADTVLSYASVLANTRALQVGREAGYSRAALLRGDFSSPGDDVNRTVTGASLTMRVTSDYDITVRFYTLAKAYTEGDSVYALDTLRVIPDPDTGSPDRIMKPAEGAYPLPADLVQGWIRGDSVNNGIAIVYQDDGNARLSHFESSEVSPEDGSPPTVRVQFSDLTQSTYFIRNDATFVRPTETTSNLIVSDGYVRRVWFRMDLDALNDSSAVHSAKIRFSIVPGTVSGIDQVELYIPGSDNPASSAFLTGTPVTNAIYGEESPQVEFTVTNTLLGILSGKLADNGLVMKLLNENTGVRYVQFYTSAAPDTLWPRVILTVSTPAEFDRD